MDTSNTLKTGAKACLFFIKDGEVSEKYKQIWDVIKNKLRIKFHSKLIYEKKYLKANVKEFDGVIKTNFLGDDMLKQNIHYIYLYCLRNY